MYGYVRVCACAGLYGFRPHEIGKLLYTTQEYYSPITYFTVRTVHAWSSSESENSSLRLSNSLSLVSCIRSMASMTLVSRLGYVGAAVEVDGVESDLVEALVLSLAAEPFSLQSRPCFLILSSLVHLGEVGWLMELK